MAKKTKKSKPGKDSAAKSGEFPWLGVAAGAVALGGLYWLFKPKTAAAAAAEPAPQPATMPTPQPAPSPASPGLPVSVIAPAPTPAPAPAPAPVPSPMPVPASGGGKKGIAAWVTYQGTNLQRREAGPIFDAYQKLYPGEIPANQAAVMPSEVGSSICTLSRTVPFSGLDNKFYDTAIFFMNPAEATVDANGDPSGSVLTQTILCAQAIASMLTQRGIRAIFVVKETDDENLEFSNGVMRVGAIVVRIPANEGATFDEAYEDAAKRVHEVVVDPSWAERHLGGG